ncbi:MAG: MBL fold metallo-hydrolase [Bacteroidales bacterium]|nr:MBL fold metallo-hydrolase [Bacteroidales bacterium]
MKTRFLSLVIVSILIGCTRNPEKDINTTNFELKKLDKGVYACIHKIGGRAICNAGIVDNGESTIIFDSFLSPDAAEELIETVKHLKLSPIDYVINSHYHNDHIRGNQSFDTEVKIVSTIITAQLIKQEEPKELAAEKEYAKIRYEYFDSLYKAFKGDTGSIDFQEILLMRPYFEELSVSHAKIKTRLPDITFSNEMSLDGKLRKVRLIEKGKGHSGSDLIMYLPKEKIIFAADLIFNKSHPYLADGDFRNLKTILTSLELMEINKVVPGHGDIGGKELISVMKEYIEDLEDLAARMKSEGKSPEDIEMVQIPAKYKDWILGAYFHSNLRFVFGPD